MLVNCPLLIDIHQTLGEMVSSTSSQGALCKLWS
jgi:hypothetical protein